METKIMDQIIMKIVFLLLHIKMHNRYSKLNIYKKKKTDNLIKRLLINLISKHGFQCIFTVSDHVIYCYNSHSGEARRTQTVLVFPSFA